MNLKGKVALITGGGSGIGIAIAKRFVTEGAKICITGRRREMLEKTAKSLQSDAVVICPGDVSNLEDAGRMVDTAVAFGGKLDVLINNAAIDPGGTVTDIDPELWRKVIDINLTGPFFMMKKAIPHMIKAGGGSVINIASLAGVVCLPGMPAYCSSKAGLIMLTKQASVDYGQYKIRCNVVCPGGVRTEMIEHSLSAVGKILGKDMEGVLQIVSSNVPLHRVADPEEIPGICCYLASDDSTFMTGAVLMIDGGASVVDVSGAALSSAGLKWGVS